MILIDTSAWIDFFRGKGALGDEVDAALQDNQAALCGPIVTELRRGLRSARERKLVLEGLAGCHFLQQPEALWEQAGELGFYLRGRGTSVKSLDLLIATYALSHDVPILTRDSDFKLIQQRKTGLRLVM